MPVPTVDVPAQTRVDAILLAAERLSGAGEPNQVLSRLVESAAELLSVKWAALATNEDDHALRRYTWDETTIRSCSESLPLGDSLSGWVIRHAASYRSNDVRTDALEGHVLAGYRFGTVLSVPVLSSDGHVLAVLNLHERWMGSPSANPTNGSRKPSRSTQRSPLNAWR